MNVKELIAILVKCNPDAVVWLETGDGLTVGEARTVKPMPGGFGESSVIISVIPNQL